MKVIEPSLGDERVVNRWFDPLKVGRTGAGQCQRFVVGYHQFFADQPICLEIKVHKLRATRDNDRRPPWWRRLASHLCQHHAESELLFAGDRDLRGGRNSLDHIEVECGIQRCVNGQLHRHRLAGMQSQAR